MSVDSLYRNGTGQISLDPHITCLENTEYDLQNYTATAASGPAPLRPIELTRIPFLLHPTIRRHKISVLHVNIFFFIFFITK